MTKPKFKLILIFLLTVSILLFDLTPISAHDISKVDIINYDYQIIKRFPHDKEAFTQGLLYHSGYLYESTGLYRNSSLRKVDLQTGKVVEIKSLNKNYFGEGLALHLNKLYQLTWKSEVAFVYNLNFELIDCFEYKGEGWGLTSDGTNLIMSNGSSTIYFRDPETFKISKKIEVTLNGEPVKNLNELEYIQGHIYANVWQEENIVIVEPENGQVTGIINLEAIIDERDYEENINVLNGIAYDPERQRLFITGKLWPFLYEIELKKYLF